MNLRTLYATLAGFIVYFLLSWLIYGVLLMDFYTANTTQYEGLMNEMPNMILMIIGGLAWAFLYTYIFQVLAGITKMWKGFLVGLFITFLIMLSFDLFFMASMNLFNWTLIIVDIILGSLMGGILGLVVAFVLGLKKKEAQE